jgi:hypothetical protein
MGLDIMEKKICTKCKLEKDVCEFNKRSPNTKGIRYYLSRCKKCQSEKEKLRRVLKDDTKRRKLKQRFGT